MKKGLLLLFAICAVASALSNTDDSRLHLRAKPSATVSPASEFGVSTTKPPTTTTTLKPTTTTTTTVKPTTTTTLKPTTTTTTTLKPTTTTTTTLKPTTTTLKPTTTTLKPTTTTTTLKPTTTTLKPTTTTLKPTTTTLKPTTTTLKPTTTTLKPTTTTTLKPTTTTLKPTTTTTLKPTTTTIKPTTTPPKPTPSVNLTRGSYNVTEKGSVCWMAEMALQIRLMTPKANATFIVQPKMTTAGGVCKANTANITLTFLEGTINFVFNKNTTQNVVYVDTVAFSLTYPLDLTPGAKNSYSASNKSMSLFAAKIGHSYSCQKEPLYMGNGLYLDVNQDRMQAFNFPATKGFGAADPCKADRPDYRPAIAVGVVLLVLIIIVVIAYLLGRRRRADGYQTL